MSAENPITQSAGDSAVASALAAINEASDLAALKAARATSVGDQSEIAKLNALVREGLQAPEFTEILTRNGLQAIHQSPAEFAAIVRQDHQRWAGLAKTTGFTAED